MSNFTDISTTVTTAVNETAGYDVASSYSTYVNAAISALTERETAFAVQIAEQVSENFNVAERDVFDRLEALGFAVPQPEPVAEADDASVDARITALETSVNRLVSLAERHLGA